MGVGVCVAVAVAAVVVGGHDPANQPAAVPGWGRGRLLAAEPHRAEPELLPWCPAARRDDEKVVVPSVSNRRVVDFGAGIGRRSAGHLPGSEHCGGAQLQRPLDCLRRQRRTSLCPLPRDSATARQSAGGPGQGPDPPQPYPPYPHTRPRLAHAHPFHDPNESRSVYLYPLPEVLSGRQVFGVPSISARFGTAPDFWNWAMVAVARLAPRSESPGPPAGLAE
jgi:hypothetical protein